MCGIVGYIGKNNSIPILIKGLKRLEYRGYDSAGIAYYKNNNINIIKTKGRIKDLEKIIDNNISSKIGIGHTRWATHGKVDNTNSHPHQVGNITIVHNGIIENYQELKILLTNNNYKFKSNTDTEVACAYIDYQYKKNNNMIEVLNNCIDTFIGSYALVIMVKDIPNKLFVIKKDSPLVIGIGNEENYIASDISAFYDNVKKYITLDDLELGIISNNKINIYKNKTIINKDIRNIDTNYIDTNLNNYKHYMLKEINEEISLVNKLNKIYLNNINKLPDISKYSKINIIGCGTAYYAGLIGKYLIEEYHNIEINVYIASEYRYQKLFIDNNTLIIAISQSGETADTLACIKRVKKYNCHTIGIINVPNSSIARNVDEVIYTNAGTEIAVASTKAYLSQVYILSLLAFKLGIKNKKLDYDKTILEYNKLSNKIESLINYNYNNVVNKLYKDKSVFYLGRNIDYISVLEGSLKLKEISYIHSEAYQAGELKHGTISLIEENTSIITLISKDNIASKTISNIKEVKARGAYVILLIKNKLNKNIDTDCYNELIVIPDSIFLLQPILNIIPLQLVAYYTAEKRGCDIDKPRNLAKSVTVE